MKSAIRMAGRQMRKPPLPLDVSGRLARGHAFNLGAGKQNRENFLRQYGFSGTLFSIISLLSETSATPNWRLYMKQPVDGRRRYSTGDFGSDQRTEVLQHAAIKLWNSPNDFHTGFEFREGSQMHEELTGETFWVMDMESAGFPTSMWYVRPDRMDPITDDDGFLSGWMYTGPNGEQVPLTNDEVILEKRPDPLDPYRGAGPVASIMPNIQQQRYATEYQRNLFLNGADPGGLITVPNKLNDRDFDELIDRWREGHRGIARAGHIGVLEAGAVYSPNAHSNKDMEYANLRLVNRDELREAWRVHKTMMGTADDVNRANAETAEEVFVTWQTLPRLNRRRDTLNGKLLPKFGKDQNVEFDYDDPSPVNAENAAVELYNKAQAFQLLVDGGLDAHDVLETIGLPDMKTVQDVLGEQKNQQQKEAAEKSSSKAYYDLKPVASKNPATKVYKQASKDFPASAMAWMYHANWIGPVEVPLDHIDPEMPWMDGADPDKVQQFVDLAESGKKLKPVFLVKTPGNDKLLLVDGHHRYLADAELDEDVLAFIGTVDSDHGDWEKMHGQQFGYENRGGVDIDNDMRKLSEFLINSINGHDLEGTRS